MNWEMVVRNPVLGDIEGQREFEQLLVQAATRLLVPYLQCLQRLRGGLGASAGEELGRVTSSLARTVRRFERQVASAKETRQFWESAGNRIAMDLSKPRRRLVMESSNQKMSLGGAWASYKIVLFNDTMVISGPRGQPVFHNLDIIWPELAEVKNTKNPNYKILLKTPEEVLTLNFEHLADRTAWFQAFNKGIIETLDSKRSSQDEELEDVTHRMSMASAPIIRNAEHTFTKGEWKGCTYKGVWVQGKVHGKGRMRHSDGSEHRGEWKDGKTHGRGCWTSADGSRMEGVWNKGFMMGQGTLTDSTGTVYTGDIVEVGQHFDT